MLSIERHIFPLIEMKWWPNQCNNQQRQLQVELESIEIAIEVGKRERERFGEIDKKREENGVKISKVWFIKWVRKQYSERIII